MRDKIFISVIQVIFVTDMSSLQSMKKRCRSLREKEKWKELSEVYNKVGMMLKDQGRYGEALEYYSLDEELCEKEKDICGQALAHRMMGEVLTNMGKYKDALEQTKQFLAIARHEQDFKMEQQALASLGYIYTVKGETDKEAYNSAIKFLKKCHSAVSMIPKNDFDKGEEISMKGRAKENLGTVYWHQGNREEGEKHQAEAESLYREHKLWEDLFRLTDSIVSLLLVSATTSDLSSALRYCETSMEAAHKVHNSSKQKQCMVAALFTKSKVLLLKEEWEDARDCLIRARGYGIKSDISKMVDNNLKMLVVVVNGREQIMAGVGEGIMSHTPYEGIADALCKYEGNEEKVKVVELALKYYQLAYNRADSEGNMASLPALNTSIAITYKEIGDFDNALGYFKKQLELEEGNLSDQCSTLSQIAEVREYLKNSSQQVLQAMHDWVECAEKTGLNNLLVEALQELARVQEEGEMEEDAILTKNRIRNLGGSVEVEQKSSQGSSDSEQNSENFPEVDLDVLEAPTVRVGEARRTPFMYKNRNAKGEYKLHIALQKLNNESDVIYMIEKGHPLEVEDNAGWTPLGEAVGNTNISYVKMLVNAGANINHRNQDGETPLFLACFKGWLDGVEILLDKGAKVDFKNKKGESGMAWLRDHVRDGKNGKYKEYKEPGVMDRIETALSRFENEYVRLGLTIDTSYPVLTDSIELEEEEDNEMDRTLCSRSVRERDPVFSSTQRSGRKARSPDVSRSSMLDRRRQSKSPSPVQRRYSHSRSPSPLSRSRPTSQASLFSRRGYSRSPSPKPTRPISPIMAATQVYKTAMEAVRSSSSRPVLQSLTVVAKRNTVGQVEEGMDDWLEDDLGPDKKKRKRPSDETFFDHKKVKSLASRRENLSPTQSVRIDLTNSPNLVPDKIPTNRLSKSKKSHQPKIYQALPTSRPSSPSIPLIYSLPSPPRPITPVLHPVARHTSMPILKVRVSLVGEMFLIPVPHPHLTVKWLASEASARYYRQSGSEPVLRLTTGDGAGLDPGDLVTHVVQGTEPLTGVVISWNCKPAEDRYRDACKDFVTPCFKNICERLSLMATTNTLSLNIPIKKQHAEPIFHCLKSNMGLRELNLSRCKLTDPIITLLGPLLPTLPYLSTLDLSQNLLSLQSLQLLSTYNLPSLINLSLCCNPLGDLALPGLTSLLCMGPISSLKLSRCQFTRSLFQSGRPDFAVAMKKSKLKILDFSYNDFGEIGLEILLKCLPPTLTSLNLTSSIPSTSPRNLGNHLYSYCREGNPDCDLTSLNLSGLSLTDSILPSLMNCLPHCGRLSCLSLSHNPLTANGLVTLLSSLVEHSVPLTRLDLAQMQSMSLNFWSDKSVAVELEDRLESLLATNCSRLELLVLPDQADLVISLKKVWDNAWGSRSRHRRDGMGNVELSID